VQETDAALVALSRSSEVQAFLSSPGTAVYILRRDGHIVWASPSIQDVLGYRPEDLVGRNGWGALLEPQDVRPAAVYSAQLTEGDLLGWAPLKRGDGRREWYRFDALNREGGMVLAVRRETDPKEHHFHSAPRGTPPPRPTARRSKS
jgi:PAS domain S-box-containing protein